MGKGNLRFYHPEFCQVAGCVGIFCPECGAECIDPGKGGGIGFSFELTRNGKIAPFAEKVFGVINRLA